VKSLLQVLSQVHFSASGNVAQKMRIKISQHAIFAFGCYLTSNDSMFLTSDMAPLCLDTLIYLPLKDSRLAACSREMMFVADTVRAEIYLNADILTLSSASRRGGWQDKQVRDRQSSPRLSMSLVEQQI
jgi:hypothetical protein